MCFQVISIYRTTPGRIDVFAAIIFKSRFAKISLKCTIGQPSALLLEFSYAIFHSSIALFFFLRFFFNRIFFIFLIFFFCLLFLFFLLLMIYHLTFYLLGIFYYVLFLFYLLLFVLLIFIIITTLCYVMIADYILYFNSIICLGKRMFYLMHFLNSFALISSS